MPRRREIHLKSRAWLRKARSESKTKTPSNPNLGGVEGCDTQGGKGWRHNHSRSRCGYEGRNPRKSWSSFPYHQAHRLKTHFSEGSAEKKNPLFHPPLLPYVRKSVFRWGEGAGAGSSQHCSGKGSCAPVGSSLSSKDRQ